MTGYQPHVCRQILALAGQAAPRTCAVCGLGPCQMQNAPPDPEPEVRDTIIYGKGGGTLTIHPSYLAHEVQVTIRAGIGQHSHECGMILDPAGVQALSDLLRQVGQDTSPGSVTMMDEQELEALRRAPDPFHEAVCGVVKAAADPVPIIAYLAALYGYRLKPLKP